MEGNLIDNLKEEKIKEEPFFYHYYDSLLDQEDYIDLFQDILYDKMTELKIHKIKTKKTDKTNNDETKKKQIFKKIKMKLIVSTIL